MYTKKYIILVLVTVFAILILDQSALASSNSTNSSNSMSNSSTPANLPPPSYMIGNSSSTVGTTSGSNTVTVTTNKQSYVGEDTVTISGTVSNYLGDTPMTVIIRDPVANVIKVDQVQVNVDKTFSMTVTPNGLWQHAGTYSVNAEYGSPDSSASTTFQFSGYPVNTGLNTIPVDGTNYSVMYTITNGVLLDAKIDSQSKALIISIRSTGDGTLTIDLPRIVIDAKKFDGTDNSFVILNDGQQNGQTNEVTNTNTDRTLTIPFKNGVQSIDIVGTAVNLAGSQTSSITVSTNKASYVEGDSVVVSGVVSSVVTGTLVTVQILDPNANLIQISQVPVNQNGFYSQSFTTTNPLWKTSETYTVKVQYGLPNVTAQTTFNFNMAPVSSSQQQVKLTSGGIIDVGFSTIPTNPYPRSTVYLQVNFINKATDTIQNHIDYKVSVMEGNNQVCGTEMQHTAQGSISVPCVLPDSATYQVIVEVDGIVFQPISPQTATFSISTSGQTQSSNVPISEIDIHTGSSDPSQHLTFFPPSILAAVGQTIEFGNGDTVPHEIVSGTPSSGPDGKFDSGIINSGQYYTYTITGNDAGIIHFYDKTYSWMTGAITIQQSMGGYKVIHNVGADSGDGKTSFDVQYQSIKDIISASTSLSDSTVNFILSGQASQNSNLIIDLPSGLIQPPFIGVQLDGILSRDFTVTNNQGIYVLVVPITPQTEQVSIIGTSILTSTSTQQTTNGQVTISNGAANTKGICSSTDCFNPQVVNISTGGTVTWTNDDTVGHTATSGHPSDSQTGTVFDSSLIAAGKTYTTSAFNTAGTYTYFCQVHPWMTGEIIVGQGGQPVQPSISLTTDRTTYNSGDTVTLTGSVIGATSGQLVSIQSKDPNGNLILIRTVTADQNGNFNLQFVLTGESAGTASIEAAARINGLVITQSQIITIVANGQLSPNSGQVSISSGAANTGGACSPTSCYNPQVANINVGSTVTWNNYDTVGHTATSGHPSDNQTGIVFDSSLIAAGKSYTSTVFNTAGTYPYFCQVHPWMTGEIIVGPGSQSSTTITIPTGITVSTDKTSYNTGDNVITTIAFTGASAGQNIAVSITDPTGTSIVARTVATDGTGTASMQFKLPTYAKSGSYQIAVTSTANGKDFDTSTSFNVQQSAPPISIVSAQATDQQGNPISSFSRGSSGYVKVLLYSQSNTPTLVTVNLFGSDYTALGIGSIKTTLTTGQSEILLSFSIPNDAPTGSADIYVDTFSDWPSYGGKPLTPESAATVGVQ